MTSWVLPLPPVPDEIRRAIFALEQGDAYRLGEAGVVELHAQIVVRRVAGGAVLPGGPELGPACIDPEVGAASLFLLSLATILALTEIVNVRMVPA